MYALSKYMQFYHYIEAVIPPPLRKFAGKHVPSARFQRLRSLVNTMHDRSVEIYQEKKAAIERGDEGMKQQLWEGKDLMSILREYSRGLGGTYPGLLLIAAQ